MQSPKEYLDQLEAKYIQDLIEIKKLRKLILSVRKITPYEKKEPVARVSKTESIKETIESMDRPFTTKEITNILVDKYQVSFESYPKLLATVNATLHRMDNVVKSNNFWHLSRWFQTSNSAMKPPTSSMHQ